MSFATLDPTALPSLQELAFPRAAVRVLAASAMSSQLCADLPFRDDLAGQAFARLGGDVSSFGVSELRSTVSRTLAVDLLGRDFFARAPGALGVGVWSLLGTRAHRLPGVRWVDVDSPPVARLRSFVFPERRGWLQLATCACRSHWLDAVCGKSERKLLIVMDESVLPMPAEMVMRLLDDVSRRVTAGSEVVMAFDPRAPLRPAQPGRPSAAVELAFLDANGLESVARYPRLRFVDRESYPSELGQTLALVAAKADGNAPAFAHLRLI